MPITGPSEAEYTHFLSHGGELTFNGLRATDIDSVAAFEESPLIKPHLDTGFEIQPSSAVVDDPHSRAPLLYYGGSWTRVVVSAYANGGKIIYRRLPDGMYEAKVSTPLR
jgi:hypothetical protein